VALASFAAYHYGIRDLSVFRIKEVTVKGLDSSTEQGKQIKAAIEDATGEMTTLHLDQDLLDEEMSRFPRVASAIVDADFPSSATVTVIEREDGSVFGDGADALLIASDGTVLGSPGDMVDQLPLVGSGDPPRDGRLDGRALEQAVVLGAVPRELRSYVDRSDFGRDGVEVTLSNGLVLLFGDSTKAEQKWKAAASVIADPGLTDAGYVDLSVPRRPAVGTGDRPPD
jgi:cell division protein FtsQ